jgi:hypothetical protein
MIKVKESMDGALGQQGLGKSSHQSSFSAMWGHSNKAVIANQEDSPHQQMNSWHFQSLELQERNFCCKPQVWYFVIAV